MATGDLRDIVIFASKQIYERGFEMLQYCFYDFRLDVVAVAALANLFKDVDIDRVGEGGGQGERENKAGYTALGAPKHLYKRRRYGPTDGPTYGQTLV